MLSSLALLTDFYQFTMAYGYWKLGMHDQEAVFHLIFRKHPFGGNYAVCCGLNSVIAMLKNWQFSAEDLKYLGSLTAPNGDILFPKEFLKYLKNLKFSCDIDAIPEGMMVFPNEPLLRIKGPLLQCQLLESTLLNIINFQTLIATKASRSFHMANGQPLLEFGLRRAQGPDGALSASRAAYIGGCESTSNVLAGKTFGIPVRGTHAHSWVTAFPTEMAAFEAYAQVMPQNCILLVDTYDTIQGVKHAITIGKKLQKSGGKLLGIRIDSGDLATLSIKARILLDKAGFKDTEIIASNSLDEYVMEKLKGKDAQISIWGVGTNLVTAYDHPALDGVYKLSALKNKSGKWEYKLKISEQPVKISNPGIHQVRRYFYDDECVQDVLYDVELGIDETPEIIVLNKELEHKKLTDYDASVDLLVPIFKKGKCIHPEESIHDIRQRAIDESTSFLKTHKHKKYDIAIEKNLFDLKQKLIRDTVRNNTDTHKE